MICRQTVIPVVAEIERRLSWQPQTQLPLRERIRKLGSALLALKEIEHFQAPQPGNFPERLDGWRIISSTRWKTNGAPAATMAM